MHSSTSRYVLAAIAAATPSMALVTPDGEGKLPTLGWNSWNAYHCDVSADKILEAAQGMIDAGLQAAGYNYVNIDDCWAEQSRLNGHIVPNTDTFPDGISGVADKVHGMNFKLGIYSSAGTETCAGYPASIFNEEIDAADFASWGVDYLKYDNCNIPQNVTDEYVFCSSPSYVKTTSNGTCTQELDPTLAPDGYDWTTSNSFGRYNNMSMALQKQSHEIVLSLCIWGTADPYDWANKVGVSFRMSNDIEPDWADITRIINENTFRLDNLDFYSHNDMDMLEIGNGISPEESRTHMAFWAALKSPLIIGTNITALGQDDLDLLKNKYLLAFNQDDQVAAAARAYDWGTNPNYTWNETWPAEYWSGNSSNGVMVLMLNPGDDQVAKTVNFGDVPELGSNNYSVTDVWTGDDLGCMGSYSANVSSHDTAVILVGGTC